MASWTPNKPLDCSRQKLLAIYAYFENPDTSPYVPAAQLIRWHGERFSFRGLGHRMAPATLGLWIAYFVSSG